MIIRFSISADQFNPHEFLKQALELPGRVKLWEEVDVMKESGPGITFDFPSQLIDSSLEKFLFLNKDLFQSLYYNTSKELIISFDQQSPVSIHGKNLPFEIFTLKPSLMTLLGELGITVYITNE
jgi:hypothetical protein